MKILTQQQYDELLKRGLDSDKIKALAESRGYSLPKSAGSSLLSKAAKVANYINPLSLTEDIRTGAAKGFIGDIARPTAQALQGLGQRFIAGIDPTKNLEQIRDETGFRSLKDNTPEGQAVVQALKTNTPGELAGRVGVNIASFFVPTAPAAGVAGRALQTTGRATARAGIGVSSKEAPLLQAYKAVHTVPERIMAALGGKDLGRPILNAETAIKNALFGTESMIGVQAKRAATNIWDGVINPALKKSPVKINMPSFINELKTEINKIPELTRRKEIMSAVDSLADDYKNVKDVSLEELQKFKEGWAKFLPDKVYRGKPIGSSFREVQNMAADLARNKIYKALENIEGKAAYFDYGNLKNLQELGQKAMTGSKLKGGAGSFIHGLYDKIITPIATTAGLTLYKTGEGLEFVGRAGSKVLGDLFR